MQKTWKLLFGGIIPEMGDQLGTTMENHMETWVMSWFMRIGAPKKKGTFLGVSVVRIMIDWGMYFFFCENSQIVWTLNLNPKPSTLSHKA